MSAILMALAGFLSALPTSVAAEFEFVGETIYPVNSPRPIVTSLIRTGDGGYLIVGSALTRQIWILKADAEGNKQWDRIIEGRLSSEQRAIFALETQDGGYLVAGEANAVESMTDSEAAAVPRDAIRSKGTLALVVKLDSKGDIRWRKDLGKAGRYWHSRFVCGARAQGGFILVGVRPRSYEDQPTSTGKVIVNHPWLVKLNSEGTVIWEREITGDAHNLFNATYLLGPSKCGGPLVEANGDTALALAVHLRPASVRHGKRIIVGAQEQSKLAAFAVKLDGSGHEKARTTIADGLHATLVRTGEGYLFLDHPAPVPKHGIRRVWLAPDLKILRQEESSPAGFRFELQAAVAATNGRFHLLGNYVTETNGLVRPAVAALNADGTVTAVRTFGSVRESPLPVAIANGSRDREIAVLLRRDEEVKLVRLKYRD